MGLLDNLFQKAPDRQIVQQDPAVNDLINAQVERASKGPEAFAQAKNVGIDQSSTAPNFQMLAQQGSRTGEDQGMLNAIQNVYRQKDNQNIERLKQKNAQTSEIDRADALRKAAMAAMGRQQVQNDIFGQLTDAYNQQEAARAQFVSGLFGIGRQAAMMGGFKGANAPSMNQRMAQATQPGTGQSAADYDIADLSGRTS